MTGWPGLQCELDAWGAAGRTATLWWRDDDAQRPGPALDRLLALADGRPLALAVIPDGADPALAALPGELRFLPHGWRHLNHAGPGEKKSEFGPQRPLHERLAEVALGWERLRLHFAPRARPLFVPPWNRIGADLAYRLGLAGIRALSRFGPRQAAAAALPELNCHVDIVDWRGSRGFAGEAAALGALAGHLAARRLGVVDAAEATGLMTHHLAHDAACWSFLERLLAVTAGHPAVRWLSVDEAVTLAP